MYVDKADWGLFPMKSEAQIFGPIKIRYSNAVSILRKFVQN